MDIKNTNPHNKQFPLGGDCKKYRHRLEMPLIFLSFVLTLLTIVYGIVILAMDTIGYPNFLEDFIDILSNFGSYLYVILFAPILIYLYRSFFMATARAESILVSPDQFPELFALYQDIGKRLHINSLPSLYVTSDSGAANAFALGCNQHSRYIFIRADIVLSLQQTSETIRFLLAHELAHHKLRHASVWRTILSIVPSAMVLPGQALSRAQEYSADRLAYAACLSHANIANILTDDQWVISDVDQEVWLKQHERDKKEFFVRIANMISSRPIMIRRYSALRDIEDHGFDRHGSLF